MSRILVSALSEHTVPNFLLIKQMNGLYDELLFVTTEEVDAKGREAHLLDALGLPRDAGACIAVDGNDFKAAKSTIQENWAHREGDEYLVNMTGGTKMMALAVYEFFLQFRAKFYYVPIGKNVYCDIASGQETPIGYRISLKEYFTLYGLTFTADNSLMFGKSLPFELFRRVRRNHGELIFEMVNAQNETNTPEKKKYYSGRWFEEYVFLRLKKENNLDARYVAKDVKLFRSEGQSNDNELDVICMIDNALHVVECKVSMRGASEKVDGFLYKLAAVSKDFGLQVKSYLCTMHKMNDFSLSTRQAIEKRRRILGIKGVLGPQELYAERIAL